MADIKAAMRDLPVDPSVAPQVAVDRHFAAGYRQRTDGQWSDRPTSVEHIAHLRGVVASVTVDVIAELAVGRSHDRPNLHEQENAMDDARLPTYDHRRGEGPTLIFLHYWGGSARTWRLVTERLPGRDVVTVDHRGWSRSRGLPGPYALKRLGEDTLAVVEDVGAADYVLVGHSMGGKVAQLVAATRPPGLLGIVFVAAGPAKPPAMVTPEYQETLSHAYDSDESIAFARDNVLTATQLSDETKAQIAEDSAASADAAARTEWPLHGIAEDITEQTRKIDVPALVIAGERDQVEPPEFQRDNLMPYLADVELRVIPETGHLIPLEAPAALSALVAEFVSSVPQGASS